MNVSGRKQVWNNLNNAEENQIEDAALGFAGLLKEIILMQKVVVFH